MKLGSRASFALVWLIVITFGVLITSASHTAVLDPKTVEVAYLFDEGERYRRQGHFWERSRRGDIWCEIHQRCVRSVSGLRRQR